MISLAHELFMSEHYPVTLSIVVHALRAVAESVDRVGLNPLM